MFNLLPNDLGCSKFNRTSHVKKALGFNQIKDIIEVCKADSTFEQTIHYRQKSLKSTKLVRTEVKKGKWQIRKDTLMLTWLSNEAGEITHTYLIKKNKLTYFHYDPKNHRGGALSKYNWKLSEGSNSLE
ncbi:hypothetical protein HUW51_19285 [Adhaeribacter swui]|uniref:Uncharacterized protein n=1 Tax=Adhaeribacter swui TaxID=2086471 RepID=A0A7G7GC82_9BACT|nr:hypothetical protein [Adhaeribacter swui]QNF34766.1 hypothetical protein HUW51_19285 [Adhaeribacter swui]